MNPGRIKKSLQETINEKYNWGHQLDKFFLSLIKESIRYTKLLNSKLVKTVKSLEFEYELFIKV